MVTRLPGPAPWRTPVTSRRQWLRWSCGLAALWAPAYASTQVPVRTYKVGILSPGKRVDMACGSNNQGMVAGCLTEQLRALGYDEKRNVVYLVRFAEGASERLPALAAELVSLRPDVIFTHTARGAEAAANATRTIPIVIGPVGEATLERLAGNLARPVGNVTGLTLYSLPLEEKCLQLLKELAPRTSRVAVLVNPDDPGWRHHPGVLADAARQLGFVLIRVDARNASELPKAFAAMVDGRIDAIFLGDDAALAGSADVRKRTSEWAIRHRMPLASTSSRVTAAGGLVAVGTDIAALGRRAAYYIERILNGAVPADLPVERPTTYTLTINRKTAAALGLAVPQALLLRADEVIS